MNGKPVLVVHAFFDGEKVMKYDLVCVGNDLNESLNNLEHLLSLDDEAVLTTADGFKFHYRDFREKILVGSKRIYLSDEEYLRERVQLPARKSEY